MSAFSASLPEGNNVERRQSSRSKLKRRDEPDIVLDDAGQVGCAFGIDLLAAAAIVKNSCTGFVGTYITANMSEHLAQSSFTSRS
jgi:hypothetical protein